MEGVKVSIDRIVVDFTDVYWTFFNPLRQWLCDFYNAALYVKHKGFKYHVCVRKVSTGHIFRISLSMPVYRGSICFGLNALPNL